ncbi:MAG: hypothetical protein SGJ19_13375 [Planctomycetia bacterium]|nr:hypothetical protein [Planctomycetia bacterium]
MAFRQPKGWLLTASPRRNPRQPFRRALFPRGGTTVRRAAPRQPAPAPAPAGPWWKAMLDALAMAPARNRAPRENADRAAPSGNRLARVESDGKSHDSWRPVTERLDRQREQLTSMDGHLRRLVELQSASNDKSPVYAPPA